MVARQTSRRVTAVIEGKEGKSWDESVYVTTVALMVQTNPETDDHSFHLVPNRPETDSRDVSSRDVHYFSPSAKLRQNKLSFLMSAILIILLVIL